MFWGKETRLRTRRSSNSTDLDRETFFGFVCFRCSLLIIGFLEESQNCSQPVQWNSFLVYCEKEQKVCWVHAASALPCPRPEHVAVMHSFPTS